LGSSSSCASSLCSAGSGTSASSLPISSRAIALAPAESPYVLGSDPGLWLYQERTPGTVKAVSPKAFEGALRSAPLLFGWWYRTRWQRSCCSAWGSRSRQLRKIRQQRLRFRTRRA
jgi:hypothetical protein